MNSQQYAIEIESIMRGVFSCQRFGFGGIVNSDFIRTNTFTAIISALAYKYANADKEQMKRIDAFIDSIVLYIDMNIDILLSCETSQINVNNYVIELGYPNGQAVLQKVIEDFKEVIAS